MEQLTTTVRQASAVHPDQGQATGEWRNLAACRNEDPELWFPLSEQAAEAVAAMEICGRCPVARACLDGALREKDQHGIRGGFTADDRRGLLRRGART